MSTVISDSGTNECQWCILTAANREAVVFGSWEEGREGRRVLWTAAAKSEGSAVASHV